MGPEAEPFTQVLRVRLGGRSSGNLGAELTLLAKIGAKVLLRVSSVHSSYVSRGHDWFSCFTCKISYGYERYSISIFCRELLKMLDNALKHLPPPFAV